MPPLSDFVVARGNNTWQKHGQDQYALGNYAASLDAFTKAVHLGQGDRIGILDNRAAAFCRLGNLESGLGDGRRMIKTNKQDPRGYLRTAKVLQLMKKMDEALRVYDHALKTLDSENEGILQIRALRAKLDKAVNGERMIDPFTKLPAELISEILAYLDLKTLLRVVRVSKLWLRLSVPLAKGFSHLDLSIARRAVPITPIRAYIQRTSKSLTHVTLDKVKPDLYPKIVTLLSRCPSLSHLIVDGHTDMTTNFVPLNALTRLTTLTTTSSFVMTPAQFVDILRRCHRLERVEVTIRPHSKSVPLPTLPNLRSVTIEGHTAMELFYDENIAERLPNLEELSLWNETKIGRSPHSPPIVLGFTCLRRLQLVGLELTALPELPKTLEYLNISMNSLVADPIIIGDHFKSLENLKTAIWSFCAELTVGALRCLLTAAKPSLTRLELQYSNIDSEELKDLMNANLCENITFLSIDGLVDVDDDVIETIIDTMPKLEVLEATGTSIGPLSLKSLADTDKLKLKKLSVGQSGARMDQDAIAYAQSRGIEVRTVGMVKPRDRQSS